MFSKIFDLIEKYNTIIIHRHSKPDGDAIGAQIGLKEAILATFPNKSVFVVGDESARLNFLGFMDNIEDSVYNGALAIVVDSGAEMLVSDERFKTAECVIKIDHHIPQGEYGDVAYVDTSAESCCGVIVDLIRKTPLVLNKKAATALYTGMVTDSGRFRFSSTDSETFTRASRLMKEEIDLEYIYNNLYSENLDTVLLRARTTLRFKYLDGGIAYLVTTYKEVLEENSTVFNMSRGMVNLMSGIEGINIWVNFTENEEGKVYLELRSNKYNINQIATYFGGGGHMYASGATLDGFEKIDEVLDCLVKLTKGEFNV